MALWCGDRALDKVYTKVFGLARRKDVLIADLLISSNGLSHWNVRFLRVAHDWEIKVFLAFFDLVYSTRLWETRTRYGGAPLSKGHSQFDPSTILCLHTTLSTFL